MKILTVLGARPQFIKAAALSRAFSAQLRIEEVIVHTGQHFDKNMSAIFFEQLEIPEPSYNLKIAGMSHGAMTARMLENIEHIIHKERPQFLLVYGDTNSTLAGALAASKLGIPIVHIEAGLRSDNLKMPEEINRVLTDRLSSYLFCPSEDAVNNLKSEGFPFISQSSQMQVIENVGDVMIDALEFSMDKAINNVSLANFGVAKKNYILCTVHRQENVDKVKNLQNIISALQDIASEQSVLLPLHPRTRLKIEAVGLDTSALKILPPLPYLEMQRLIIGAICVLTDSGGLQKEAYFHATPCVTMRDETEWNETVSSGWNTLVGNDAEKIKAAARSPKIPTFHDKYIYGTGNAAQNIAQILGNI